MNIHIVKWIPGGGNFVALTLGNHVFIKEGYENDEEILRHEMVHVEQYRRLGIPRFLAIYIWEFLVNWFRLKASGFEGNARMEAYYNISLEREAYGEIEISD